MEDILSKANYVHECNFRFAADLSKNSTSDLAPELYVRHHYLLREWLTLSLTLEAYVLKLEADYGHVDGATCFDAILSKFAEIGSPKPVTIDSAGHVYEVTGERAIMPGIDPARVSRSINDAKSGRTRSLKEIIAARSGGGIRS